MNIAYTLLYSLYSLLSLYSLYSLYSCREILGKFVCEFWSTVNYIIISIISMLLQDKSFLSIFTHFSQLPVSRIIFLTIHSCVACFYLLVFNFCSVILF